MAKKQTWNEFNNEIYPISVFIGVTNCQDDVSDVFCYDDGTEIDDLPAYCDAIVLSAMHKKQHMRCVVVVFRDKKTSSSVIAHEALHAADLIGNWVGLDWLSNGHNEAYAYLLQWVVRCCNVVIKGKED